MGEKLERQDAIIPRIGASITTYGTAVIRQFEMMDTYSLVGSIPLGRSRSKLRALQLLSRKGLGMPVTGFAHDVHNTRQLIKLVGGAPVVVKLMEGTQGRGVVLAETVKAAESVIEAFTELKADFLVQEFIKEAGGSDVRCFVIGNRVVAAMERISQPGEFRSNLHRGGSAQLTKLTLAGATNRGQSSADHGTRCGRCGYSAIQSRSARARGELITRPSRNRRGDRR